MLYKMRYCNQALAEWGKSVTGNFRQRVSQCHYELKMLHTKEDAFSVARYKEVRCTLFSILDQKEVYWKQRAKQFMLKEGDKNSKYFHTAASSKNKRNLISQLRSENGTMMDWDNGLVEVIERYYSNLFTTSNTSSGGVHPNKGY